VCDSRPKTAYILKLSLRWLLLGCYRSAYFWTLTFKENVTEMTEARRRFKSIADYLRRRGVFAVGAFQRQNRGAWHVHLVVTKYVDVNQLREFAMARGWGSFLNVRKVTVHDSGPAAVKDIERVVHYISRYVSRDFLNQCGPGSTLGYDGEKLTIYVGKGLQKGVVRFGWVGGLAAVYRAGCYLFNELYHSRPGFADHEYVMRLGLEAVIGDPRLNGQNVLRHFGYRYSLPDVAMIENEPF